MVKKTHTGKILTDKKITKKWHFFIEWRVFLYDYRKGIDKRPIKTQPNNRNFKMKLWKKNWKRVQIRFNNIVSNQILSYGSNYWTIRHRCIHRITTSHTRFQYMVPKPLGYFCMTLNFGQYDEDQKRWKRLFIN